MEIGAWIRPAICLSNHICANDQQLAQTVPACQGRDGGDKVPPVLAGVGRGHLPLTKWKGRAECQGLNDTVREFNCLTQTVVFFVDLADFSFGEGGMDGTLLLQIKTKLVFFLGVSFCVCLSLT